MAQVVEFEAGQRPIWMWDVSHSVGPGRLNARADVGLVQLLLNTVMRNRNLRDARQPFRAAPENPLLGAHHGHPPLDFLTVDGWYGPETANAIKTYQAATGSCVRDGVVSPIHPLVKAGSPTFRTYTIWNLNYDGWRATGKLLEDAKFPNFLTRTKAAA